MIFLILNNVFSTRFSRFTTPDPTANQYPSISPYAYCAANLLRYSDPTGMFITANDEDDREYVFDPEEGIFTDFLGNTSDNFFIEELTTALSEICSTNWKSHATLTLLAKQDCPLWLQLILLAKIVLTT